MQVRGATDADAAAIRAIYEPIVEDTAISFEVAPIAAEEIRRRMAGSPRLPWLVATQGERIVGYAYASSHRQRAAYRWSAECSAYVADGYRGQGVGRRLYEQLVAEMRELGFVSLLAGITLPNDPSVRLHEALGFRLAGVFRHVGFKHGAWHDVGWWQLAVSEVPTRPDEPREWGSPPGR